MAFNNTDVTGYVQTNGILDASNITQPTNDTSQYLFGLAITVITLNSVILVIGIVGNSLLFCICMRKDNRKKSFMLYLAALSVSDTVNCFGWVPSFFNAIPGFSWGHPHVYCKLLSFIFCSTQYISSWLLVAILLERAVSTKLPHHVARISSQGFGIKTISILTLISVLVNSHYLYGLIGLTDDYGTYCQTINGTYTAIYLYFRPILDVLLYSLIPGTLIIICNTVMVNSVTASARIRGAMSDQTAKRNRELMIVAVLISMAFIILTAPNSFYMLLSGDLHNPDGTVLNVTASYLTERISYINNAINLFLYILSGSRFRKQLKEIVLCKMCRRN